MTSKALPQVHFSSALLLKEKLKISFVVKQIPNHLLYFFLSKSKWVVQLAKQQSDVPYLLSVVSFWSLFTDCCILWQANLWKIFLEMSTLLWKQLQEIVCRVIQEDDSCLSSCTCNIVMDHTRKLPINKYLGWATYIHHFPTKLANLLSFSFKTFVKSRQFVQNVPGKWAVKHALTWQAYTGGFPSPITKWHLSPQLLILSNLSTWLNSKYCIGKTWWNIIDCNACCVGVTAVKIMFLCYHCCYYVVCERKDQTTNFSTQGFIQTTRFLSHTSQINLSDLLTHWTIWHIFQTHAINMQFPTNSCTQFFFCALPRSLQLLHNT